MKLLRGKWGPGTALLTFCILCGVWLARLDYRRSITTDVLDLVPDAGASQSPELALVRSLASQAEIRTMLFEITMPDGGDVPADAGREFAAALLKDPAFAQAFSMGDTSSRDALGKELFEQRFSLLLPFWLESHRAEYNAQGRPGGNFSAWLAEKSAADLSRFLAKPQALAFQDLIPSDPLLLLPGAIDRLQDGLAYAQSESSPSHALVWAQLAESPLSEAGQGPAFDAIARATDGVRKLRPGLKVAFTGVNRFAAASRRVIEREVTLLNTLSLAAVLIVAFTFIRSPLRGLHLIPVVALSILGAWVAVTLAFARVHILVFVVGSLLTGVAIDYGFYLYMQPAAYPGEDYWSKVRRLLKPLLASCVTTVAGFALLLLSDFPFIRQLGVFVGGGLLSALGVAILYFAIVKNPFLESRSFGGGQALAPRTRRRLRHFVLALWVGALPGLAFLTWRDDIRDLDIPSDALKREDARIRGLFGDKDGERMVYLTHGDTLTAARASLEKLQSWLNVASAGRARAVSLGAVVPTAAAFERAQDFIHNEKEFPAELKSALAKEGFEEEGFNAFFADYARIMQSPPESSFLPAFTHLREKLVGPLGLLVNMTPTSSWFVTLVEHAPSAAPPEEASTISTGQLQTLNRVFADYRASTLRLSLIGLGIVGLGVFLTYGFRDGLRIFAIPCGACLGVFGLFGWIGHPLNLFHLLGAFLGVCLTHNYSIFSATSAYEHKSVPVSVRVSALTTAASFGVLAISSIPVVRALGTTVASMVITALVVIELEHLSGLGKRA